MNILGIITERNQKHLVIANAVLLSFIFFLLVVVPFIPSVAQKATTRFLYMGIFFGSVYALTTRTKIVFSIAAILSVMQVISQIIGTERIEIIVQILNTLFFIYAVIRLVKQFVLAKEVSPMVILGAINGYLLIGLVFSILVLIVTGLYHESYLMTSNSIYFNPHDNYRILIYYTFMTMTTVGYVDIIPVSPAARSLAVMMAVCGQLYMTVVLAFLVGKFAGIHGRT